MGQTQLTARILSHMPLSSNLTTKQLGKVDKAALHNLVLCAGIPWDTVKAAIGKYNHRRQPDGRLRGGEVVNMMGSACLTTTAMTTNTTMITK
jgi:hypothetical protein